MSQGLRRGEQAAQAASNAWLRAGLCTACGPRAFNEDAHVLLCDWAPEPTPGRGPAALFAVCDGHGGSAVARWTAKRLADELRTELDEGKAWCEEDARRTAAECAFLAMDRGLRVTMGQAASVCGATCVAAAVCRRPAASAASGGEDRRGRSASRSRSPRRAVAAEAAEEAGLSRLLLMNVGDSRALLCRHGVGVVKETLDHKPDHPKELARIRASDGFVSEASALEPARVDGVLSVARALGDFRWKADASRAPEAQRISPMPDVYDLQVQSGDVVVLACDGVFDVMSSEEAASTALAPLAEARGPEAAAREAAEAVVRRALEKGTGDNVTCVVVQVLPD